MKIKKGSNRYVLLLPAVGLVIKLPRIFLRAILRNIFDYLIMKSPGKWRLLYKFFFVYSIETYGSFQRLMFKGLIDNWQEYLFYRETRHVFIQPTYFSFFGLVNIQKYGYPEKIRYDALLRHFCEIVDSQILVNDGHHFADWRNFSFESGKIKILDYGSLKTRAIIAEHGEKIYTTFNIERLRNLESEN